MDTSRPAAGGNNALERRQAPRRRKQVQVLFTGGDPRQEPFDAWLLNYSTGGLRLAIPFQVAIGRKLKVRRPLREEETPWVPVQVKNCNRVVGSWQLSCQFLREPTYSTLLQFG